MEKEKKKINKKYANASSPADSSVYNILLRTGPSSLATRGRHKYRNTYYFMTRSLSSRTFTTATHTHTEQL